MLPALAHDDLIGGLGDENYEVAAACANALYKMGEDAEDCLRDALYDGNMYVRKWAATILGNIGCRDALFDLVEATGDETITVRAHAVGALGKVRDGSTLGVLIGILEEDPAAKVRAGAAWALGRLGDPRCIPPLCRLLRKETNKEVRKAIMNAIKEVRPRDERDVKMLGLCSARFQNAKEGAGNARQREKIVEDIRNTCRRWSRMLRSEERKKNGGAKPNKLASEQRESKYKPWKRV
ncbi:MAG: HEAT repeat domain-containing protein [Candidatus Bilamarchaeaceae archaeon]